MGDRIGILGGTFDPPHVGHLVAAAEVRHRLLLDRILFVVANDPWQKTEHARVTSAVHRLEMVRRAVEGIAGLEASTLEVDRGGPSYMVDTLGELADAGTELFLILGHDAAVGLPTWRRPEELKDLATLVVVNRPSQADGELPVDWCFTPVDMPEIEVASRDLRARVRQGAPITGQVPQAVRTYIERTGLYRDGLGSEVPS